MVIFGKRLSGYVAFCRVFLILILVVGIARLTLSLAGVPNSAVKWLSMTAAVWIGVVYYSVRVPADGFGSYKQLLPIVALLNIAAQAVAMAGIAIAIFSGTNNVFSAPEYAFGGDGRTWLHLGAHAVFGTTVGTLIPWLAGSAFLAATRRRIGSNRQMIRNGMNSI